MSVAFCRQRRAGWPDRTLAAQVVDAALPKDVAPLGLIGGLTPLGLACDHAPRLATVRTLVEARADVAKHVMGPRCRHCRGSESLAPR